MLRLPFYFSREPRFDSDTDPIGLKFSALKNLPESYLSVAGCLFRGGATIAGEIREKPGGVSLMQQINI